LALISGAAPARAWSRLVQQWFTCREVGLPKELPGGKKCRWASVGEQLGQGSLPGSKRAQDVSTNHFSGGYASW
jgi:hypothetical protein